MADQRPRREYLTLPSQRSSTGHSMVRAIEARRRGVYALSEEEQAAIDAARRSEIASDEKVHAFWKRFGIAIYSTGPY